MARGGGRREEAASFTTSSTSSFTTTASASAARGRGPLGLVCLALLCGLGAAEAEFAILEEAQVVAAQMRKLAAEELGVVTMQVRTPPFPLPRFLLFPFFPPFSCFFFPSLCKLSFPRGCFASPPVSLPQKERGKRAEPPHPPHHPRDPHGPRAAPAT